MRDLLNRWFADTSSCKPVGHDRITPNMQIDAESASAQLQGGSEHFEPFNVDGPFGLISVQIGGDRSEPAGKQNLSSCHTTDRLSRLCHGTSLLRLDAGLGPSRGRRACAPNRLSNCRPGKDDSMAILNRIGHGRVAETIPSRRRSAKPVAALASLSFGQQAEGQCHGKRAVRGRVSRWPRSRTLATGSRRLSSGTPSGSISASP